MEAGNGADPFNLLAKHSHMSDSQDGRLRYCSFASTLDLVDDSEPSDRDGILVECNGIVMVSPPDSLEHEANSSPGDMYLTPPEGSDLVGSNQQRSTVMGERREDDRAADETLGVGTGAVDFSWKEAAGVVDLGRDSDLGFSSLTESPPKRLKIYEKDLGLESPRHCAGPLSEKRLDGFSKSSEGLVNSGRVTPLNEDLVENNTADDESGGSSAKKKLTFSDNLEGNGDGETDFTQSTKLKESGEASGFTEGMQKAGEEAMVGNGVNEREEMVNGHRQHRVLPPSISGGLKEKATEGVNSDELPPQKNYREVTILDVLKVLKDEEENDESRTRDKDKDDSLANVSILDILKSRGMTFPRPSWWREGGYQ